jgi:hypothetical protein
MTQMRWLSWKTATALSIVVGLSLVLTLTGNPLSAQQAQYEVTRWDEPIPALGPDAPEWDDVSVIDVSLIPQGGVSPNLTEVSIPSISVQAIHDRENIAFRLVWEDETYDVESGRPDQFSDAAAIQFPVTEVASPNIAMGAAGQLVNIWQWRADLQTDLDHGFQDLPALYPHFFKDYYFGTHDDAEAPFSYPSDFDTEPAREWSPAWAAGNPMFPGDLETPVENLIAEGFGTLTSDPSVTVNGSGYWDDGTWRVVISRELNPGEANSARLAPGQDILVAVAVWNGSNLEVAGRKQHSTYMTFALQGDSTGVLSSPWFYTAVGVAIMAIIAGVAIIRSRTQTTEHPATPEVEGS